MCKSIGILGGMGPAATCDLMKKIISKTNASCDQQHIHIYVDCNTAIPDRTEAILHHGCSPLPEMIKSGRKLQTMGADVLLIPCNTAHYYYDALADHVAIPILHMPVETSLFLKEKGLKKVGILATDGTVQSGVYERALQEQGIQAIYPTAADQALLMKLIYSYIKKGVSAPSLLPIKETEQVIRHLKNQGAQSLILGCTELPVAFDWMGIKTDTIDPTSILAQAAIRFAGAQTLPFRQNSKSRSLSAPA